MPFPDIIAIQHYISLLGTILVSHKQDTPSLIICMVSRRVLVIVYSVFSVGKSLVLRDD